MDLAQVAAGAGSVTLIGTALALGIRHGVDWDHIAAITDITASAETVDTAGERPKGVSFGRAELHAVGLSSLYALGHAVVVALLGLAALYFHAILPDWVDPIMERVVGVTLLVLGVWVFFSLAQYWRGTGDFRLQSRWMLVFAGVRRGWHWFQHRRGSHTHSHVVSTDQYGPRTAFSVGLIHGIGAETGSQVLIIAAVGGAASQGLGTAMMFAFIVGLLISNTAIAVLSASGFISASRAKVFYVLVGVLAGTFSLVVGSYFVLGLGHELPSLEGLTAFIGVEGG